MDVNLDMVRRLGADTADLAPRVYLGEEEREAADSLVRSWGISEGDRIVGLHPAGSWPSKTWPRERFGRLGDLLAAHPGLRLVVMWGPGERELARAVAGMIRGAILAPTLGVRSLAALLEKLDVWVGNDSGPKHLAASVGTATVSLYGPTDARTWAPPGERHVALQNEVPCGPCDRTTCDDMRCLLSISPERVAGLVMALLKKGGRGAGPLSGKQLSEEIPGE